jgi:hydrogenase nickel incorporation protein HypA/HybF
MHEMGIAMQIVDIATEALPDDMPNVSVGKVNLKIGKLAAVRPSSLRFC